MCKPTKAVYEAGARARIIARIPGTTVAKADQVLADEFTRELWLSDELRAAVDAVWRLAVTEVRRQVATDIRSEMAKVAVRAEAAAGVTDGTAEDHPFMLGAEWAAVIAEGVNHG